MEIRDKFKLGNFLASETLRKEKLEKDFRSVSANFTQLLTTYGGLIEKYERSKERELEQDRRVYRECTP